MKTTLRIPDPILEDLRRLSQEEGPSLNATAVAALQRGLGHESEVTDLSEMLGTLVVAPASRPYDAEVVREWAAKLDLDGRGFMTALEWSLGVR